LKSLLASARVPNLKAIKTKLSQPGKLNAFKKKADFRKDQGVSALTGKKLALVEPTKMTRIEIFGSRNIGSQLKIRGGSLTIGLRKKSEGGKEDNYDKQDQKYTKREEKENH